MDEKILRELQLNELELLKEFDRVCTKNKLKYSLAYGTAIGAVRHKGFIPWDDDIDVMMPIDDYMKLEKKYYKDLKKNMFFQNKFSDKNFYLFWNKIRKNNTTSIVKGYENIKMNYGICMDIFPLFRYPKDEKIASKHFKYMKLSAACLESILYKYKKKNADSIASKFFYFGLCLLPRKVVNNISNYFLKKVINYDGPFDNYIEYSEMYNRKILIPKSDFENLKKIQFEDFQPLILGNIKENLKFLYGDYMKLPPESERVAHGDLIIKFNNKEDNDE